MIGPVDDLVDGDASTVLDDPVGASLRGAHAHLARGTGRALAYRPDVATFVAAPTSADWADLATLLGPGGFADVFSAPMQPPADWAPVFTMTGVQMVGGPSAVAATTAGTVRLGPADVPEMLELAALTRPGPFWPRTVEMGDYLGIRDAGRLVAMIGERLHPPGWTEISAVCTHPDHQGRGYAARLVRAAAAAITARGERPFLHVASDNDRAIALYERLGFRVRREVTFRGYRVPG